MKINLRSQDTFAGLFFIVFGAFSLYLIAEYPVGTAVRMGPGYFPTLVGWSTIVLGVLTATGGMLAHGEPAEPPHLRALFFIAVGILLFGFLIDSSGLVVATAILVAFARLAGPDYRRVKEIIVQYVVLTIGVAVLFIWVLRLPIPIWPV